MGETQQDYQPMEPEQTFADEHSNMLPELESLEGRTVRMSHSPHRAEMRVGEKRDIYQMVTDRIIEQLEAGVIPWNSPISQRGTPRNLVSEKDYRGINPFVLWTAPYDSRYWVTYRQAQGLGGNVKRGERGYPVVYWHWRSEEEMAKLAQKMSKPAPCYPFYSTVFNLEQCEGLQKPEDDTRIFEHEPRAEAERVIREMPNRPRLVNSHTERPFYQSSTDTVSVPVARRFETADYYYSTMFHELGHSTGHESRLNRLASAKNRSFGSEDYSFEELVAEMTAAFLCVHCGIENQVKPAASYIYSWLAVLRQDKKILLDAATAAQKATDYILGRCLVAESSEEQAG